MVQGYTAHVLQLPKASVPHSQDAITACSGGKAAFWLSFGAEDIARLPSCWHLACAMTLTVCIQLLQQMIANVFARQAVSCLPW